MEVKRAQLRLACELWLARHGWLPLVVVALFGVLAVVAATVLPGLQADLAREMRRNAFLARQAKAAPSKPAPAPRSPQQAFFDALTPQAEKLAVAQDAWDAALASGLRVERAEYRGEPDTGAGFSRLDLRLPVSGTYPAIKRYVFGMMASHPGLALDKIEVKRERAAQEAVEVQLQFSLFVRSTP
jgi:hypothetical protein